MLQKRGVLDNLPLYGVCFYHTVTLFQAFAIIDKNKDRVVSSEEIDQLSWDGLREVANEVN